MHASQPDDVRIAILLGDSDVRLGKYSAAVTMLEPMEDKNSQNLDFEYVLGTAMIHFNQRREGVARIEKVAEGTHSADAYILAGSTLLQLNEYEQARRDLDEALVLNDKLPGIYSLAGMARKHWQYQRGRGCLSGGAELTPDDFTANLYLGAILFKRRDLEESQDIPRACAATRP